MSLQDFSRIKAGNVSSSSWCGAIGLDVCTRCLHCFHIMYSKANGCAGVGKQASPRSYRLPPAARVPVAAAAAPRLGTARFQLPLPLSLRPHRLLHLTRWQTSKKLSRHMDGERNVNQPPHARGCDLAIEVKRQDTTKDNVRLSRFSQRLTACSKALRVQLQIRDVTSFASQGWAARCDSGN